MKQLRQQAEAKLKNSDLAAEELAILDSQHLLQELRTHHIELELQNEELLRTQQSLLESRDRYAELYHSAPVGYMTLDKEGGIIEANMRLATMLDTTIFELVQTPLSNHISSEDQDTLYLLLRKLNTTKSNQSCELRLRNADGKEHWVLLECNAAIDDGDVTQIRTSVSDIDSLKQTEQLLKNSRSALENSVTERIVELETAKSKAEQACQSKSDILSFIILQLRTPVSTILGFTQKIAKQIEDEHKDMADSILISSHYLLSLVNDLKNLHRIESGPKNPYMPPVELCQILEDCLSLLRPMLKLKQIRIQDEITPLGELYIKADSESLKQVLTNLITYTVKHACTGEKITLSYRNPQGIRIRICITHNGPGITEEDLDNIFTPLTRSSKNPGIDGTGIGLIITRKLVEQMHGLIGVESSPCQGNTFWIELDNVTETFKQR